MNLRYITALAWVCALAGCANVDDVRSREPIFFGSTARPADQYVGCVAAAWQGNGVTVERQAVPNGYELIVPGSMGIEAVLTAATWKGKTDVSLSTRIPRYSTTLVEAVNLCI